jgi:single-stranded DNA-binding protein
MGKSLAHDQFDAIIVGNLVSEPRLLEDEEGNKVCWCTVATNPRARKVDPMTGRELTPEERNKTRSFVDLKIAKTSSAEKFAKLLSEGDRVRLEGEMGTKKVEKSVWSKSKQKRVPVKVDVDGDRTNIQEVYDDRWIMWVDTFSKVIFDQDLAVLGYA